VARGQAGTGTLRVTRWSASRQDWSQSRGSPPLSCGRSAARLFESSCISGPYSATRSCFYGAPPSISPQAYSSSGASGGRGGSQTVPRRLTLGAPRCENGVPLAGLRGVRWRSHGDWRWEPLRPSWSCSRRTRLARGGSCRTIGSYQKLAGSPLARDEPTRRTALGEACPRGLLSPRPRPMLPL
jgi:hypothetical protein